MSIMVQNMLGMTALFTLSLVNVVLTQYILSKLIK